MKHKIILFVVVFALLTVLTMSWKEGDAPGDKSGLPQLRGYQWKQLPEVRAKLLMPRKWFYATNHDGKAWRYFISEYEADIGAGKGPALRLVVTTDKQRGKDARGYVMGFDAVLKSIGFKLNVNNLKQQPPMVSRSLLYKDDTGNLGTRVVMRIVLGNLKTGKVYDLQYAAPQEQWVNVLSRGKKIMGYFQLDPNF